MEDEGASYRHAMVDSLVVEGRILDPSIETAFRSVPRHLFLPGVPLGTAYADEAIPIKQLRGRTLSSASQPSMIAIMLEQLSLVPGQRVLEIGAGTGYNAALISRVVGPAGSVTSLDLDDDLVEQARRNLAAAGFEQISVIRADGAYGYSPAAPYDRIILTVGASDVSPAWIDQLASAGRLVLPLALRLTQRSLALERRGDHLASVSSFACGFVALRGLLASPDDHLFVEVGALSYLLVVEDAGRIDPCLIQTALDSPGPSEPIGVHVSRDEIYDGLIPWLELEAADSFVISASSVQTGGPRSVPVSGGPRTTIGLLGATGFALLGARSGGGDLRAELLAEEFGEGKDASRRLVDLVRRWAVSGRRGGHQPKIRIFPAEADLQATPSEQVIAKRWSTIAVDLGS